MQELIRSRFSELTKSEKKVANYVLNHNEDILLMNIYELAKKSNTSTSAISRFSKKVFDCSFADAKIKIAKNQSSIDKKPYNMEWETDFNNLPESLANSMEVCIRNVIDSNGIESLAKAVDILAQADTVFVHGIGNSGIVAQDFVQKMFKIRKKTLYSIENNYSSINSLMSNKNDVIVAISNSGNTQQVIVPVQISKSNGSRVIAISGKRNCKLVKLLDENDVSLLSLNDVRDNTHRLGPILSRYSQLFILDLLFIGLSQKLYDDPTEIIESYRNILGKFII